MRRSGPMPRTSLLGHPAWRLLPLLSLALAIWACGFSLHLEGATPLKVADVPAAQLRLEIQISDQFSDEADIFVRPLFFEGPNPSDQVALPDGSHVTCNGMDITPASATQSQPAHKCARQPPGGSYRITYTDTHGASTSVIVAVPSGGAFEILAPAPNTTLRIPTNGQLEIRYSVPVPPPNGMVSLAYVAAECRSPEPGCVLSAFPPFGGTTPSGSIIGKAATRPTIFANPLATPSPKPGSTPKPPPTTPPALGTTVAPGNTPTPTAGQAQGNALATVDVRGDVGTILLRGDFSTFQPGPGSISLNVTGQETLDHTGFAAASVSFASGDRTNDVTWTR